MEQSLNSIEKIIWSANKHGRNYISFPPCDVIPSESISELSENGFICKQEPTISGNSIFWIIFW